VFPWWGDSVRLGSGNECLQSRLGLAICFATLHFCTLHPVLLDKLKQSQLGSDIKALRDHPDEVSSSLAAADAPRLCVFSVADCWLIAAGSRAVVAAVRPSVGCWLLWLGGWVLLLRGAGYLLAGLLPCWLQRAACCLRLLASSHPTPWQTMENKRVLDRIIAAWERLVLGTGSSRHVPVLDLAPPSVKKPAAPPTPVVPNRLSALLAPAAEPYVPCAVGSLCYRENVCCAALCCTVLRCAALCCAVLRCAALCLVVVGVCTPCLP
jgi:hypothetical protein